MIRLDFKQGESMKRIKRLVNLLLSYLPTALPVGLTEFHVWADSVIDLAGQFADSDSMKWALASQVLHLDHKLAYKSKNYFVNCLRKAAANQVVSQAIQDIKDKQQERAKAEAAANSLDKAPQIGKEGQN